MVQPWQLVQSLEHPLPVAAEEHPVTLPSFGEPGHSNNEDSSYAYPCELSQGNCPPDAAANGTDLLVSGAACEATTNPAAASPIVSSAPAQACVVSSNLSSSVP